MRITNETVTENRMAGVSGGHVNHIVDRGNNRIINITQSDHIFANGLVIRSVIEKGGVISIMTYGEGVNKTNWSLMPDRASWAANYVLAFPGFAAQDRNIRIDVLSQSSQGRNILHQEHRAKMMREPKF